MVRILTAIYGVILGLAIFFFIRMLFSVYYTPGTTVLYNSPITQSLFPADKNKVYPTWGYNKLGMYDGQPFKFGAGKFWPESGHGYVPNKFGSGGPSPSGGMRSGGGAIPYEVAVGWWNNTPHVGGEVQLNIYDHGSQEVRYETPVGWWGK
jgi:hypothetical protein